MVTKSLSVAVSKQNSFLKATFQVDLLTVLAVPKTTVGDENPYCINAKCPLSSDFIFLFKLRKEKRERDREHMPGKT